MSTYRCHFLDKNGRLADATLIVATDVGEAVERAFLFARGRSGVSAVELWSGKEKVYRTGVPKTVAFASPNECFGSQ
jgi:hypothetical protein